MNDMEKIEDFLQCIWNKNDTIEGKAIRALKARGFLIDKNKDYYYLSDNAHEDDFRYLRKKLSELAIGELISDDNRIVIYPDIDLKKLCMIFSYDDLLGCGACLQGDWNEFICRKHGVKFPVQKMEPFVTYYVKAISSCGVRTGNSCDGNYDYIKHSKGGKIYVESNGEGKNMPNAPYLFWHRIIWEKIVVPRFGNLPFIETGIKFTRNDQFEIYKKVFEIADYLYENRLLVRKIKETACRKIGKSKCRRLTSKAKDEKTLNNNIKILEKMFVESNDFSSIASV